MYFFDSFFYPFNSQGLFNRILVALLLTIIPVVGTLILTGYGIKIIGEVYRENKDLPEFEFGTDLNRGLMAVITAVVYMLPTIVLSIILGAIAIRPDGTVNLIFLIVLLPVAMVSTLALVAGYIRFGISGEAGDLFQIGTNLRTVAEKPVKGLLFFVNGLLYAVFVFVASSIGLALFIIPGLIILTAAQLGTYYLYAQYGFELEIGGKRKIVVDDSYTY